MSDRDPGYATPPDEVRLAEFLGEPQRPRWRRHARWIVAGVVVLLLVLLVARCARGGAAPDYIAEPVQRGSLDLAVTATGSIRPTNIVQVGSEVSGRIDSIFVDVNDRVKKGQVIAIINTDVIDDQIRQAGANLAAARASVAQAEATLGVDQAQLARLQAVHAASAGKVPSQTELQAAEGAVARDRAVLASARANVGAVSATLSTAQTNRSRAQIRSPVAGVVLARQVEPGQTVAAAFNTPTLFIIAEDLSAMQLRVAVDEASIGRVRVGQRARFSVDAYPGRRFDAVVERVDLASTNTASTVSAAGTAAGAAGASNAVVQYEARLRVDNTSGLLRPGMTATATIATARTGLALLVPNGALRFRPDRKAKAEGGVFDSPIGLEQAERTASIGAGSTQTLHVLEGSTLRPVRVVTGESDGRQTAVTAPALRPGMKVVTGIRAKE